MLYQTDRLVIRKFKQTDAADLFEYVSDANVIKYLTFPKYENILQVCDRINYVTEEYKNKKIEGDFAIQLKQTGKVIGSIGVVKFKQEGEGTAEVGYILNPKFQHNGYMTEALVGMFNYLFNTHKVNRIEAKHDTNNPASGSVMKRANMKFEGVLRKAFTNNSSARVDVAVYSILKEEFK